jgi:hypothetical protein
VSELRGRDRLRYEPVERRRRVTPIVLGDVDSREILRPGTREPARESVQAASDLLESHVEVARQRSRQTSPYPAERRGHRDSMNDVVTSLVTDSAAESSPW